MKVLINGEPKDIEPGTRLPQLLSELELKPDRIAIELNRRILRKSDWDKTELAEGDAIEVVSFVGGGDGRT